MVTMNIIDSTLVSICREMGLTMMKTAYSTIFNEGMDFTCGLGNTKGEMIGVAEFNPSQIGGLPLVLQTTSQEIPPDSLAEGDVIVTNDPYRGGMHTPEHTFIKPVFVGGVLYGYAVAIGHVAEVGGMVPGGFAGEATEIFHEGLRVPPVKIKKAGHDVPEVWKLMLANVRTPRANYGDYRAMISAVDVGAARLESLIEKYGTEVFSRTVTDLMDYSEARMRAEIGDIEDGKYSFEDYMEDDGIEAKPYKIHVDVHIHDSDVVVDYSATDDQSKGPINAVLSVAWSSAYNAFLHLTDPSIPKNSGCFRPIKIIAPGGSLVNADYPATCVGGNTETHIRIAYTIIGAMAKCLPERAFATDAGTHSNFLFGAVDPRSGEYVVCYDFTCAAWGGRAFADGNEAVNCINGNSRMVPIEVFETRYPWLIEEFALQPDSAGPGRYRGAHAITKTFRAIDTEITVSSVSDRHSIQPWGLLGGGAGATGGLLYQAADGADWQTFTEAFGKISPSKFSNVTIAPGARVRLTAPGAGGYGPAAERPREMIAEDLREGWITPEGARRDYAYGGEVS
jgi:N-methylhydantoinase B/oxoprolinase/acetone carboxylase alpha subunit